LGNWRIEGGGGRGGVLPGLQHQEQEQPMSVTYGRNVPRAQLLSRNAISDRREIEQARLTFSGSGTGRKLPSLHRKSIAESLVKLYFQYLDIFQKKSSVVQHFIKEISINIDTTFHF